MGALPHLEIGVDQEIFNTDFASIMGVLNGLKEEVGTGYDLLPDHPITTLAIELFDEEMDRHFEDIKVAAVKAQSTIDRYKRGGNVKVTKDGKKLPIDKVRSVSQAGVRTGWMMGHFRKELRQQSSEMSLEGYGYEINRVVFPNGRMAELVVKLDVIEFYRQYPIFFDEWLEEKIQVGLIDLRLEAKARILQKLMRLMVTRIDAILNLGV